MVIKYTNIFHSMSLQNLPKNMQSGNPAFGQRKLKLSENWDFVSQRKKVSSFRNEKWGSFQLNSR
jgi:hypothetical protein